MLRKRDASGIGIAMLVLIGLVTWFDEHGGTSGSVSSAGEHVASVPVRRDTLAGDRGTRPIKAPSPARVLDVVGDVPDGDCPAVVPRFLARVEELRRAYDTSPLETFEQLVHATQAPVRDAGAGMLGGLRARPLQEVWFESLRGCAELRGESVALEQTAIATFVQEPRPALAWFWLELLGCYDACDADVFAAVHGALAEWLTELRARATQDASAEPGADVSATATSTSAGIALPDGVRAFQSALTRAAVCPDLADRAFRDLLALIAHAGADDRDLLWMDLAVVFPYSSRLGVTMLAAVHEDPASAFGVVEALRRYASEQQVDLSELLGSDPDLVRAVLVERTGGAHAAWAMAEMLGEFGGVWGNDLMIDVVTDEGIPADERSEMVALLGDAPHIHWTFLRTLIDGDATLAAAAYDAIGQKARDDPDAYGWLKSQLLTGDGPTQQGALVGLAASGREDLAAFLRQQVFPQVEGAARRKALEVYAQQADADPAFIARLTDASVETDPGVRMSAAYRYLLVSRDLHGTADLLERMIDDPDSDVAFTAALVTEQILKRRGDPASLRRWGRYDTVAYRVRKAVAGIDADGIIAQLGNRDLDKAKFMASVTAGTPTGISDEQQAWLIALIQELEDNSSMAKP